jgi:hypothetical protein
VIAWVNLVGSLCRSDPITNSKQKVFSWKAFATFVHKQTGYKAQEKAHPVLDAVASELLIGSLIRRNRKGYPVKPWSEPSDLPESYLDPCEVNQLAIMKKWRLSWSPTQVVKKSKMPTVAQQVQRHGWKATLQIEATRVWKEQKSLGVKPVLTRIAEQLYQFALKHQIRGDHGKTPTAGYIRTHVISLKAWTRPL